MCVYAVGMCACGYVCISSRYVCGVRKLNRTHQFLAECVLYMHTNLSPYIDPKLNHTYQFLAEYV